MESGRIFRSLVPARCPVCREPVDPDYLLCGTCIGVLNEASVIRDDPPEGIDQVVSCADHEGVARDLLAAYKFRHLTGLAPLIAGYMADAAEAGSRQTLILPMPPARLRTWLRGFDPVADLTLAVAAITGIPLAADPVITRVGSGRQRGRNRSGRLTDPPDIRPVELTGRGADGQSILLVDDVMTTGATLSAAVAALRLAGASDVDALTFTRRL